MDQQLRSYSSQRVMTPVSENNLKPIPSGFTLEAGSHGCLKIFGFIFFLPGLFIMAPLLGLNNIKAPQAGTAEWATMFLLAFVFMACGLFMGFYRSHFEIDLRNHIVIKRQGIFRLRAQATFPLDNVKEINISRMTVPDSDGVDDIVYPVSFVNHNGDNFAVGYYLSMRDALQVGLTIATRMGLKAFDTSTGNRQEINSDDLREKPVVENSNSAKKIDTKGLQFKWDGNSRSLSRLSTATRGGIKFFKIGHSKFLIHRMINSAICLGIFVYFFGWNIAEVVPKIFSGYLEPDFTTSVERFFTTIISTAFVLFLLGPTILTIVTISKPRKYTLVAVSQDGLYIHSPHKDKDIMRRNKRHHYRTPTNHLFLNYRDIVGMEVKGDVAKDRKFPIKLDLMKNFIAIRSGSEFYEIAPGLEKEQLQGIADEISPYIKRNTAN